MAKACDISSKLRKRVTERDSIDGTPCCIICGTPYNLQIAHYLPRSQGGKGIEENLGLCCIDCHSEMDNGFKHSAFIRSIFKRHLMELYPTWDEKKLVYNRWESCLIK